MTEPTPDLPALPPVTDDQLRNAGLPTRMEMSPGLAIFFDDALYTRCKNIAGMMSRGASMTPAHLRDKPEACFAVVSRSIVWKLDPFAVAMSTYQTPGGSIGYEGKLIQAILERSGQVDGQIRFTHNGDWSVLSGKFELKEGRTGGKYPAPTWTLEDAKGLSVTVAARIKGEVEDRTLIFDLGEAWPLNSPLWATAPKRQICYTAVRAFANLACPSLLFGIPFDVDPSGLSDMRDITPPRPLENEFSRAPERDDPVLAKMITKANFANNLNDLADVRAEGEGKLTGPALERFAEVCDSRARGITENQDQRQKDQLEGPKGDQVEKAQEGDAKVKTPAKPAAKPAAGEKVETPFQRGTRLLALIKTPPEVVDLHIAVGEELRGKDAKLWKETCQAKWSELGGTGTMPKVAVAPPEPDAEE